jgi:hypothetical protein
MKKAKRMPIFQPFFLLVYFLKALFWYFPQWIFGFWWCARCDKRYWVNDEQYEKSIGHEICESCKTIEREAFDRRIDFELKRLDSMN